MDAAAAVWKSPLLLAELPLIKLFATVSVPPWLKMPPPNTAEFPVTSLFFSVRDPRL